MAQRLRQQTFTEIKCSTATFSNGYQFVKLNEANILIKLNGCVCFITLNLIIKISGHKLFKKNKKKKRKFNQLKIKKFL